MATAVAADALARTYLTKYTQDADVLEGGYQHLYDRYAPT